MAGIVNRAECAVQRLAVGLNFDCDVKRERIMGLIVAPRNFQIPNANLDSWEQILKYFQDATMGGFLTGSTPTELPMIFPLTRPFFGAVDNTEEATPIESGYGNLYGYTDNYKQFQFELDNYGVQWWKEVIGLNGGNWSVYIVEKTFVEGRLTSTGWAGYPAHIVVDKPRYDGANGVRHYLNVALTSANAMGSEADVVQFPDTGYDLSRRLNGNTRVNLVFTPTNPVAWFPPQQILVRIQDLRTAIGGTSLVDTYGATLLNPALWELRGPTGANIPIESVVFQNGILEITSVDGLGTKLPSVTIGTRPPFVLANAGIGSPTSGGIAVTTERRNIP